MNRLVSGVATVLVSLLVVGVVRAAIPPYAPDESPVTADGKGVVALEVADIELLDVHAVRRLQSDRDPSRHLETNDVFVVARVRLTPHGGTLGVLSKLHTADGRRYQTLNVTDFPYAGVAYVGQIVTETHIFEVPEDRLAGAQLTIRGVGEEGVQAIKPVAMFPLEVHVDAGTLIPEWTSVEPAR